MRSHKCSNFVFLWNNSFKCSTGVFCNSGAIVWEWNFLNSKMKITKKKVNICNRLNYQIYERNLKNKIICSIAKQTTIFCYLEWKFRFNRTSKCEHRYSKKNCSNEVLISEVKFKWNLQTKKINKFFPPRCASSPLHPSFPKKTKRANNIQNCYLHSVCTGVHHHHHHQQQEEESQNTWI